MDISELSCFINHCRKYHKRIDYIVINTTSKNYNHYNFYYKAILNIPYHICWGENMNRVNKVKNNIHHLINGKYRPYYIKVECKNDYDRIVKMSIALNNIKEYTDCKVIAFYKDQELEHPCYDNYIKAISNDLEDNLKKRLYKDDIFIDSVIDKYWQKYYRKYVNKINYRRYTELVHKMDIIIDKLKSNKNSYILSKLTDGDLNKEDVSQYPDLINTFDELTKLKITLGLRKSI